MTHCRIAALFIRLLDTLTNTLWFKGWLVTAVPVEALLLWLLFATLPLDVEAQRSSVFVRWAGEIAAIVHLPGLWLFRTNLIEHRLLLPCILFLVGYGGIVVAAVSLHFIWQGMHRRLGRHGGRGGL